jgi:hypothetical protein
MRKIIPPSGALAEMLARDAERDPALGDWGGELATPGPPEPQAGDGLAVEFTLENRGPPTVFFGQVAVKV